MKALLFAYALLEKAELGSDIMVGWDMGENAPEIGARAAKASGRSEGDGTCDDDCSGGVMIFEFGG